CVLTGLLRDPHGRPGHDFGQILRLTLSLGFLAEVRLAFLRHDLLVGFSGRHGQALGQQEIAGVPRCDLDYLPPDAQLFDVFSENDFHISSRLERGRERQQRDVPRLLDRVREPALVRRAHARNAARHDLAPLRHEGVQHLHVLVVDIVDLLDAEPAYLLAPEILLLLGGNRLVAARGALRRAAWSSFRFRHGLCLLRQARKGRARYWSRFFLRLSNRFSVSSMRTVRNFRTTSDTRRRRSNSFTTVGSLENWKSTYVPSRYLSTR